jgi:hypothetical protein
MVNVRHRRKVPIAGTNAGRPAPEGLSVRSSGRHYQEKGEPLFARATKMLIDMGKDIEKQAGVGSRKIPAGPRLTRLSDS